VTDNDAQMQALTQQLVDARTIHQVDLIDRKLAVLKKYQQ